MAASISYFGSFQAKIHQITLQATSVEGIAHALPTAPDIWSVVHHGASAATSVAGFIAVTAVSAASISFQNFGIETLDGTCFIQVVHSLVR